MLKGMENMDPPQQSQQCLPFEVIVQLVTEETDSPFKQAFQDNLLMSFFWAMRSCEYLDVDNNWWKEANQKKPSDRRTTPVCCDDYRYWKDHRIVPIDSAEILEADSVTIRFPYQKRRVRDDRVTQTATGDPRLCQVKSSDWVVMRMHDLIRKGLATNNTPFFMFLDRNGKACPLKSKECRVLLRDFVK